MAARATANAATRLARAVCGPSSRAAGTHWQRRTKPKTRFHRKNTRGEKRLTPKQATRREIARARGKEQNSQNRPYDAWQLPSGKRLAEFALASGFLAPPLMENARRPVRPRKGTL